MTLLFKSIIKNRQTLVCLWLRRNEGIKNS